MTPTKENLVLHAPLAIWEEAIKQAKRSDHKRHRTGCVIFYGTTVFGKGCAHTHNGGLKIRSVHAEMDAINKCGPSITGSIYYQAVVVTLTKGNNFASISKPCVTCAKLLETRVCTVTYCERNNDDSWRIETRSIRDLEDLALTRYRR